ncbi:MAG TPA: hypothetical protein VG267_01840 [Terracidiphilus sp.]|jgi:hypothetical protein|nr:hypothetical protein [Terracidiphilus sp.]
MVQYHRPSGGAFAFFLLVLAACCSAGVCAAPEIDSQSVMQGVDRSVAYRDDQLLSYTVTEHYTVFRNDDNAHPAAEMTVKTTYAKNVGKSYQIVSESGPALLQKEVLGRALENEKTLNEPANRAQELITSANYEMTVEGEQALDGRDCFLVAITPRRISPFLFKGKIWVDAANEDIARLNGVAAKSASVLTGPAQLERRYGEVDGLPMATHASATVSSWLLGPTRVEIEYSNYAITRRPGK